MRGPINPPSPTYPDQGIEAILGALITAFMEWFPFKEADDEWHGLIAFPNVNYQPPGAKIWLRFHYMPGDSFQETLGPGGLDQYNGIFQVDINIPEGAGEMTSRQILDDLRACFTPSSLQYGDQTVQVLARGPAGAITANQYYTIPFTVRWRASVRRDS